MNRPYASVVREPKPKRYKMTDMARNPLPSEEIKQLLKTKVNPGEIKVGVNSLKSLHGGVLIETNSIEQIEILGKEIQTKCGGELETHIHRLRKPRVIILNVPEDINTDNIEEAIIRQNPDLNLRKGSIVPKFTYVTKRMHRNAVVDVGSETRKTLTHRKIKLGWQICRTADYITATRCFNCSKFNHRTIKCRGEVACPLCAGPHNLKECKSDPTAYKCTNCETYNRHNPTKKVSANHSALDKGCPSHQAILERNRLNTEYYGWLAYNKKQDKHLS